MSIWRRQANPGARCRPLRPVPKGRLKSRSDDANTGPVDAAWDPTAVEQLLADDRALLWHAYASAVDPLPVLPVVSASSCSTAVGSQAASTGPVFASSDRDLSRPFGTGRSGRHRAPGFACRRQIDMAPG